MKKRKYLLLKFLVALTSASTTIIIVQTVAQAAVARQAPLCGPHRLLLLLAFHQCRLLHLRLVVIHPIEALFSPGLLLQSEPLVPKFWIRMPPLHSPPQQQLRPVVVVVVVVAVKGQIPKRSFNSKFWRPS